MAEEYKNNVTGNETPVVATDESSTTEVKDRGLFNFLGKKKEEVKPQELEHKTNISGPEPFEVKHEEEEQNKEDKPTLLEQLHKKHEEEEENKPNLLEKVHRSNSSSSSSSDEEDEKKQKKKIVEGEEEKKGIMDKIKEKLPGHEKKQEDSPVVNTTTLVETPMSEHPEEKKGIMEKIKEKLPGYHGKTSEEEAKKEKESK